ncbi:MAG: class I SAM-dependent methyltransferase [Chloroflexota bacterium]
MLVAHPLLYVGIVLIILTGLFLLSLVWSLGGLWLPSSKKNIRKMLKMAKLAPGETLYDLGSGNGRIIILAAKEFGAIAVGIEIDAIRYYWSRFLIALNRLEDQVSVIRADMFAVDLSDADVISAFLLQKINNRLMPKFIKELKPGTRVVANTFIFPGWEVIDRDEKEQLSTYIVK